MKVLHIGKFYPPYFGGIEKVNYDIVEGLSEQGVMVDVLCFNHKKGQEATSNKYKIYRANTLKVIASTPLSLNFIFLLKKIQYQYDIIHIHLPNPMANLAVYLTRPKAKIVLHWHSDIIKQKNILKIYKPLQNWLLKKANKIVITTPTYLEESEALLKYKDKTVCIPIGIDSNEIIIDQAYLRKMKDNYKGKRIVFALGRLIYYKGFKYLIDSAKYLPNNIVILIAGEGELEEKLQRQIEINHLKEKVKLIGKISRNQLGSYYALCDVFCLPSVERSEAFGVVQIEAMAFAKPIISTNIKGSGVNWVNQNNISGITIQPKNVKALAESILSILSNEDKYEILAQGAKQRYVELFTKDKMIEKIKNLYIKITERL
ncbi:glycosyltransferase [Capnocytophaga stomatis]|uniref:glycosyltransferase n=1 Tax=Capnocytophaga stomatis TaxID=1848904 RepID=UPI00385F6AEC